MKSGALRHRVTIQRPEPTVDTAGDNITVWTDVETVKASIHQLTARELVAGEQRLGEGTYEIRLHCRRSLAAMAQSWRVVYGDRIFVLDGPPNNVDERNREIILTCLEGLRDQ